MGEEQHPPVFTIELGSLSYGGSFLNSLEQVETSLCLKQQHIVSLKVCPENLCKILGPNICDINPCP